MKVLIFGGTSEGRLLASALSDSGICVTLSVATEFGHETAAGCGAAVISGRLEREDMTSLILKSGFKHVVDATHPHAVLATENIRSACSEAGINYYRLKRPERETVCGVTYVPDISSAVGELQKSDGKALLTTGSKELGLFTQVADFRERLFVRILPMTESLEKAIDLGYKGSHIICMQGPFDVSMNTATLLMTGADILVTKDSGDGAGFEEKVEATLGLGRRVIAVSRPVQEEGFSFGELLEIFGAGPVEEVKRAFFPMFTDMTGRKVLVIGGGNVAERRIGILTSFGAEITVISPEVGGHIKSEAALGAIRLIEREYEEGDIANLRPHLVITATDRRQVNHCAMREAKSLDIYVSVSDRRDECTCCFPAIAENESFIAGLISKDGNHREVKRMAAKMRRELFT